MTNDPGGLNDRLNTLEQQMREIMALLPRLARADDTGTMVGGGSVIISPLPGTDDSGG